MISSLHKVIKKFAAFIISQTTKTSKILFSEFALKKFFNKIMFSSLGLTYVPCILYSLY